MKIKAIPFVIGAWIPYIFDFWANAGEFALAATIIMTFLVITKNIKLI